MKLLFTSMGGENFAAFWIAVVGMLALTELLTDGVSSELDSFFINLILKSHTGCLAPM